MSERDEMMELYAAAARASKQDGEGQDEMPPASHENESFREILEQIANATKATLEQLPALRRQVNRHDRYLRGDGEKPGLLSAVHTLKGKVEKLEEENERETELMKNDRREAFKEILKLALASAVGAIGSWLGQMALNAHK